MPSVRSASSRFHSAIRRHICASVRQADSRLTRLVPTNLEFALTPLPDTPVVTSRPTTASRPSNPLNPFLLATQIRLLLTTARVYKLYLLTYLTTALAAKLINVPTYRPIGRYRRSKHSTSVTSLNMTCRLLYAYFRLQTAHCL